MKIAYIDCISGISGDMMLSALVDVLIDQGEDWSPIQDGIKSLGIEGCYLEHSEVKKFGFRASHIDVIHQPEHAHRHLHHINDMIDGGSFSDPQKDLAKRIFAKLAQAEAKVHGSTIEKVHFHEVGAVDSIADIVGCAIGWDLMRIDRVVCAPIPTGMGRIKIAHGWVSVPAPATAELLKGIPTASSTIEAELTTPTGAAIAATICEEFGGLPAMRIGHIGIGSGDRDLEEQGNILRLMVGEACNELISSDQIQVLETNLDDVTGEVIGHCIDSLFNAGALDVYSTAIQMKKNRPGVQLTVLCEVGKGVEMESIIFKQTKTLGIRRIPVTRTKLQREATVVTTKFGEIAGKRITFPDGQVSFSPEYDSCSAIAREQSLPIHQVMREAEASFAS